MLCQISPDVHNQLTDLATWVDRALTAFLNHRPVEPEDGEDQDAWQHRCFEAWTASGDRAIAEEETATIAATIAQVVLDAHVTPVVFVEKRAGVVTEIRLHPHESLLVTFDWDDVTSNDLLDAKANLKTLIQATDELPVAAQKLIAETIIEAKQVVHDRQQATTQ